MNTKRIRNENGYTGDARYIFGLCNDKNMLGSNEFFAEWYLLSFNEKELDKDRINEWIDRFMTGTPFAYMDRKRLQVYIHLVNTFFNNAVCEIRNIEEVQ